MHAWALTEDSYSPQTLCCLQVYAHPLYLHQGELPTQGEVPRLSRQLLGRAPHPSSPQARSAASSGTAGSFPDPSTSPQPLLGLEARSKLPKHTFGFQLKKSGPNLRLGLRGKAGGGARVTAGPKRPHLSVCPGNLGLSRGARSWLASAPLSPSLWT